MDEEKAGKRKVIEIGLNVRERRNSQKEIKTHKYGVSMVDWVKC